MEPVIVPRSFQGRYEVTHLIARGGMAQVYRALDTRLGRPVALKVLFPELSVDRTFVERFRREAQAAANLSHPNVVAVYDWGEDEGTYFIVMELVSGTSLATALRAEKSMPAMRAAQVAAQVANALGYAHRNGVVHRDIKPGNVLLTDDGQVKVTDFGIAQAVSTEEGLTMAGSVMGTAAYFSPEQAEGALVDGRSDIYSLGVVLYEMLAGRPPFVGDSPVAVASMHVRNSAPELRDLNPAVPEAIEAVTMRALAKAPADRYQTAEEFREDLLRFCDGRPVLAEASMAAAVGTTSVMGLGETSVITGTSPVIRDTTLAVPIVAPAQVVIPPAEARLPGPVTDVATRRRSSRNGIIVAVVVLVALAVVGVLVARALSATKTVTIPNVGGQTVKDARAKLHSEGFKQGPATAKIDPGVPRGRVISTTPKSGAVVNPGRRVSILYSLGPVTYVQVPAVTDLGIVDAENAIAAKGLPYKIVYAPSWTTPVMPNTVVSQAPIAGTTVESTYSMTLTLLKPGGTYPVPQVVNDAQVVAGSTLAQYGLTAGTSKQACSGSVMSGAVSATNPTAGTPVQAGTVVNLTISTGPCPVLVPDVYGLDYAQAYSAINSAGLQPSLVETCPAGQFPTGIITYQNPAPEIPEPPGTPVEAYTGCSATPTTTTTTTTAFKGGGGHGHGTRWGRKDG